MSFLKSLAIHLGRVLAHYGAGGLFAMNVLDSSFLAFPVINDLLLIHLASRNPDRGILYAALATAGSLSGSFALYGLSRGGGRFLRRPRPQETGRINRWLQRNDFIATVVASLLPPPTPFKVVPIAAGALHVNAARFAVALAVGRGARFLIEALVGMRYGAEAEAYLKGHLVGLSLATAALAVALTLIYRRIQKTVTSDPLPRDE